MTVIKIEIKLQFYIIPAQCADNHLQQHYDQNRSIIAHDVDKLLVVLWDTNMPQGQSGTVSTLFIK